MNAAKQNNQNNPSIIVMNLIKRFCTINRKKTDVSGNTSVQDVTVVHVR